MGFFSRGGSIISAGKAVPILQQYYLPTGYMREMTVALQTGWGFLIALKMN